MKHAKRFIKTGSLVLAGTLALGGATAQADDKPAIEVITHAGAGGGTDVNSRMMMLRSRRTLKQDMVVVNKRGGGGAAAMNYFMSRPADGNTILTFTVGHAMTMAKGKTKLKVEDMVPLARGTNDPQILMVNCKTSAYKTPEEFVAGMKNGDELKFGGTQTGTIDHITVYLWAKRLGVPMPTYIPFKGGGELATQLVAGAVDVGTLNLSEAAAPVENGDICPLVILAHDGMAPIPKAKTAKVARRRPGAVHDSRLCHPCGRGRCPPGGARGRHDDGDGSFHVPGLPEEFGARRDLPAAFRALGRADHDDGPGVRTRAQGNGPGRIGPEPQAGGWCSRRGAPLP